MLLSDCEYYSFDFYGEKSNFGEYQIHKSIRQALAHSSFPDVHWENSGNSLLLLLIWEWYCWDCWLLDPPPHTQSLSSRALSPAWSSCSKIPHKSWSQVIAGSASRSGKATNGDACYCFDTSRNSNLLPRILPNAWTSRWKGSNLAGSSLMSWIQQEILRRTTISSMPLGLISKRSRSSWENSEKRNCLHVGFRPIKFPDQFCWEGQSLDVVLDSSAFRVQVWPFRGWVRSRDQGGQDWQWKLANHLSPADTLRDSAWFIIAQERPAWLNLMGSTAVLPQWAVLCFLPLFVKQEVWWTQDQYLASPIWYSRFQFMATYPRNSAVVPLIWQLAWLQLSPAKVFLEALFCVNG